jgi:hypothetical protein
MPPEALHREFRLAAGRTSQLGLPTVGSPTVVLPTAFYLYFLHFIVDFICVLFCIQVCVLFCVQMGSSNLTFLYVEPLDWPLLATCGMPLQAGDTPLMRATAYGHAKAVAFLLKKGVNPDVANGVGISDY